MKKVAAGLLLVSILGVNAVFASPSFAKDWKTKKIERNQRESKRYREKAAKSTSAKKARENLRKSHYAEQRRSRLERKRYSDETRRLRKKNSQI